MPGVGIEGFTRKALQMARAGIYDLRIHHDEILWPLLRYWDLFDLQGLQPEADQARERLAAHLAKTDWRAGSRPNELPPPRPTNVERPAEEHEAPNSARPTGLRNTRYHSHYIRRHPPDRSALAGRPTRPEQQESQLHARHRRLWADFYRRLRVRVLPGALNPKVSGLRRLRCRARR